jgi:hypothetical protein
MFTTISVVWTAILLAIVLFFLIQSLRIVKFIPGNFIGYVIITILLVINLLVLIGYLK